MMIYREVFLSGDRKFYRKLQFKLNHLTEVKGQLKSKHLQELKCHLRLKYWKGLKCQVKCEQMKMCR